MIQVGCLLVAAEKSSADNVRLMEQYPHLRQNLSHWTESIFLITEILKSPDGKKESILGFSLTNVVEGKEIARLPFKKVSEFKSLGIKCRHFIGGPVHPSYPFVLLALRTSKFHEISGYEELAQQVSLRRVTFFVDDDLSVWTIEFD